MKKTTSIPIRLPKSSWAVLERVAVLAGTDVQTVIQVLMATAIEREIQAGTIPRRKPK